MSCQKRTSTFVTLGASNHCDHERQKNDYYATDPKAAELLLQAEDLADTIWECACGEGHLAKVFESHGKNVIATDLVYRGYGDEEPFDFLKDEPVFFNGDIVTNPPYRYALDFVKRAIDIAKNGRKVCMLLKITFLEGQKRKALFLQNPPKTVHVFSSRLICAMNGDFDSVSSSPTAYAWFVWEKGYKGDPVIKWIN